MPKAPQQSSRSGFTLVELLIVIVVIAILAAITIVAYNGIADKARTSNLQANLSQDYTTLGTYNVDNSGYPTNLSSAEAAGVKASSGDTLAYIPTANGYCLEESNSATSYYITDNMSSAQSGTCPSQDTLFANQTPQHTNIDGTGVGAIVDSEHALNTGTWFPEADGYIFGMYFSSSVPGSVIGVRFYRASSEQPGSVGYLWNQAGTVMASVNFTNESSSGWQTAYFSNPVAINATTTYMIGYSDPSSYFAYTDGALNSAITNGPLTAPADQFNYPGWWNSDDDAFCTTGTQAKPYATGDDVSCAKSGNLPVAGAWGANFYVDVIFAPN